MKYALLKGERVEAQPGLRGECPNPNCRAIVIAKCGVMRIWHWAHLSVRDCDSWGEPETKWHRDWKDTFTIEEQEVRHVANDGEVHFADVKTRAGNVLEFQHSNISQEERASRENFYKPMFWIVDGTRLKRDLPTFTEAIERAYVQDRSPVRLLMPIKGVPVLQRWASSKCPVYLDFGDAEFHLLTKLKGPVLWRIAMAPRAEFCIAIPISRQSFIEHHTSNTQLRAYRLPPLPRLRPPPSSGPLPGFEAYLTAKERRRRRSFGG